MKDAFWNWSWALDDVQGKIFPLETRGDLSGCEVFRGDDGHVILCCRMTLVPCQRVSQLLVVQRPHAYVTIRSFYFFLRFLNLEPT